jgi:hypothetical protein
LHRVSREERIGVTDEPGSPPKSLATGLRDAHQFCRRGHSLNARYHDIPANRRKHCGTCGQPSLYSCESCGWEIPGASRVQPTSAYMAKLFGRLPPRPNNCEGCGARFPWSGPDEPHVSSPPPSPAAPPPPSPAGSPPTSADSAIAAKTKRFLVALSFPGEKRGYVRQVADHLAHELGRKQVLYDHFLTTELTRPSLDVHMARLYRYESELIVPFYCAEYARKQWCGLESRQIRDLLMDSSQSHRVMPFRFDDAPIDGVLGIDGFFKIQSESPREIAEMILERLGQPARVPRPSRQWRRPTPLVAWFGSVALAVAIASWYYGTRVNALAASCAWTSTLDLAHPRSLACKVENRGSEPIEETVLELPFLCATASLDGSEASGLFDPKVFREDARPPAPFRIGSVGYGRSRVAVFVPVVKSVPTAAWCDPSAYLLLGGKRRGTVEITGCSSLNGP